MKLVRKIKRKTDGQAGNSKDAAKERLHLVLMQDRANVSADFLELMKQEILEVIKKYIEIDEDSIDVRLTNKENGDGTNGAPALYANIPILNIKDEVRQNSKTNSENKIEPVREESNPDIKEEKEKEDINQEQKEEIIIIEHNDEKENEESAIAKEEVRAQETIETEN